MACVWGVYLVVIVLTFSAPDRAGLAEQIRLEQEQFEQEENIPPSSPEDRDQQREDGLNTIFSGETEACMADTIGRCR